MSLFSQKGPRDQPQASRLAGTMFSHTCLKIRIVKSVSSRRLPELCAESEQRHEETVSIYRINMVDAFVADHNVVNEESGSRWQHRCAVVVRDLFFFHK